jgi:glycosyltransferase involved in cell wall biosynthesis
LRRQLRGSFTRRRQIAYPIDPLRYAVKIARPVRWPRTEHSEEPRMPADVTAVIPSIPPRADRLSRAIASVLAQTAPVAAISVAVDLDRRGAIATRNRAAVGVETQWIATLDDDDEWFPEHIAALVACAEATGADVVYPGYLETRDGEPLPHRDDYRRFGLPFDADVLRDHSYIPVTSLMRTELVHKVGGWSYPEGSRYEYEDWGLYLKLLDIGARFVHLPERTWVWHHWDGHTTGRPERW